MSKRSIRGIINFMALRDNSVLMREYKRQWRAARRAAYFADKACVRCGSIENLQLDHIDRNTKVTHNIWSWSKERRETELSKCQVLCADCHKIKTNEDFNYGLKHGTLQGYDYWKCRCDECKTYKLTRVFAWRESRGWGLSSKPRRA